jgi:hypothetical protein
MFVGFYAAAKSNNGMHPTPHQHASHVSCLGARVMPGVILLMRFGILLMRCAGVAGGEVV